MKKDGKIIIGTEVDNNGVDEGLKKIENIINKYNQTDNIEVDTELNNDEVFAEFEQLINFVEEYMNENPAEFEMRFNGKKGAQEAKEILNQIKNSINEMNNEMKINPDFNYADLIKYLVKVEALTAEFEKLQEKPVKIDFSDLERKLENIGQKVESNIKRVGKWAISLFSVASIYRFISKMSSAALSNNEQLANNVAGIWNYLGTLITPIMKTIIQWIMKALSVINYFIYALTGINFAAKMTTKSTNKQVGATKKYTQAQKELNKELAKFDEITKLTDERDTGGGNFDAAQGIGDVSGYDFELPELSEKTKQIIDNIAKKIKEVWSALKPIRNVIKDIIDWSLKHPDVIAKMLGALALGGIIAKIIGVGSLTSPVGLLGILAVLTSIAAFTGFQVVKAELDDLNEHIENNTSQWKANANQWAKFKRYIEDNGISVEELSKVLDTNTKSLGSSAKAMSENIGKLDPLTMRFQILTGTYKENKESLKENINALEEEKDTMIIAYEQTDKNNDITQQMIDYMHKYKDALEKTNDNLNATTDSAIANSDVIKDNKEKIKEADLQLQYLNYRLQGGKKDFDAYKISVEKTDEKLKKVDNSMDKLKNKKAVVKIDADTSQAEKKTNSWFKNLMNYAIRPTFNASMQAIGLPIRLPKLAKGGIVNMPSRGIPVGTAVAGERGAEGVIPLTDSQQMALLGEAIGRYITVAPTIPVYIGNRLVAREIRKIENESDFAKNV